jgi:hypothetical protein
LAQQRLLQGVKGSEFVAVGLIEDVGVALAVQGGFVGPILFQPVEVFQEQEPGGLLGVVEFGGTARFLSEHVVYIPERLLKHRCGSMG